MTKFSSLLAELPVGLQKTSGIESPDEVQLEQDFGRLAYTFLKDRAAGLLPYLLGFEVVEREEDGSKAVGIFGFKLGEDYYYVPAFFLNNQVKGMDLLFSKRTNMFMPLRETWINYIVNRQSIQLGEKGPDDQIKLREDIEYPNFSFIALPPPRSRGAFGTKYAEDNKLDSVAADGFAIWNRMQAELVASLEKDAAFQEAWSCAVSRLEKKPLPIEKTAEGSPLIDFLQKKGGVKAVNALMTTITNNHGFAKAAMAFYPGVESLFVTQFDESLKPVKEAAKITIETEAWDYADGKSKRRIVQHGFTVNDKREDDEKSEVYNIDYLKRYNVPDKPGFYQVVLKTGGTRPAYVFDPAAANLSNSLVIVDQQNPENYFMAEPGAVYVRGEEDPENTKNPYDDAQDISDIEVGGTYVALDKQLHATLPFTVKSIVSENDKRTSFDVRFKDYPIHKRPTYGHDFEMLHRQRLSRGPESLSPCNEYKDKIQLANFAGRVTTDGHQVILPSNWKVLKLEGPKTNTESNESYDVRSAREMVFEPGSLTDVMMALEKNGCHRLTVASDDGMDYYIRFDDSFTDGKPMNYKSAMWRLVDHYGLGVDDAENILKEAHEEFKSRRFVKLGQLAGVSIPPPTTQPYTEDDFTGKMMIQPHVSIQQGGVYGQPPIKSTLVPGFNIGGEAQKDLGAANLAQQAAAAGQKSVFDHATIGGLSKLYDSGTVIDSYVPELLKALDRIGRVIFLFYWKNEEFADRYGSEDLAQMEDMLRGVFRSFGDLVLNLRQKMIDSEDAKSIVM